MDSDVDIVPATGLLGCVLAADRAAAGRRRDPAAARRPAHRPLGPPARRPRPSVAPFVLGLACFFQLRRAGDDQSVGVRPVHFIPVGGFQVDVGLLFDPLSAVFVLLITGVGLPDPRLLGRVHGARPRAPPFFAYLNLFVAAMLLLVLGNSYLVLYVGWEGVGLASYLLIAFWYTRPARPPRPRRPSS